MPLPPALSPDQRQAALEKAAAARRLRAELKEKLKAGTMTLKDLLDQSASDEVVAKMKVVAVLESLPGLGKVKARRLMEEIGISETRRIQGLGDQQRKKLLDKLAPRGAVLPEAAPNFGRSPSALSVDLHHLGPRRCRQGDGGGPAA